MKVVNLNSTIVLKHDPGFFRCDSGKIDVSYIQYRIVDKKEDLNHPYDIAPDSLLAAELIGKGVGEHVKIPMEGTDIFLDYQIIEIL